MVQLTDTVQLTKEDLPFFEIKDKSEDGHCWLADKNYNYASLDSRDLSTMYSKYGYAKHRDRSPCNLCSCSKCTFNKKITPNRSEVVAIVNRMMGIVPSKDNLMLLI